jgi:hypothetical protein
MGRYAYFSTGFEYKFRFGVQNSTEILSFAGLAYKESDPQTGLYLHIWDQTDTKPIDGSLKQMEQTLGFDPLDLTSFPPSLQGTYALRQTLESLYELGLPEDLIARYILGCCIFHQLLYAETLRADFEA